MKFTITKFQTCFMTCKLPDTHICNGEEVTDNQTAKVPAIEFHAVCNAVQITVKCPWHSIAVVYNTGIIPLPEVLAAVAQTSFLKDAGAGDVSIEFKDGMVMLRV